MVLTGIWLTDNEYQVTEPATGRKEVVMIPTHDMAGRLVYDKVELQELEHFARERVEAGWKKHEPKPALTKRQEKDLGGVLLQIRDSRRHKAESLHGRYW